jgi:hypothetical protein
MLDPATLTTLRQFRTEVYQCFEARRDALVEVLDAATVVGVVPSLAYLSLAPVHRRRWGSLYDALAAGSIDTAARRELLAGYPLDDGQPVYALDTSVWPRDDAETSPGRGHYFSSSRQSAGQPIVTGWSYAWLAQLSFTHDSWTAPVDVQRVPAGGDAHAVAAAPIAELVEHLPTDGPVPLCVVAAGYEPVKLARELADLEGERVAVLVRLRSDRCFYADPPPPTGPKVGRPRQPGQKFACAEERTWWAPTDQHAEAHAQYGRVRVRAWAGVHAKTQHHPATGSYRPKAIVRGTLVLVEVEHLPRQTRIPKRLWLWWRGPGQPDLAVVWRAYVRRFDREVVNPQVTKARMGAALGGRDHVPNLHRAIGHHHSVDQQFHELSPLLEGRLFQSDTQASKDGQHRPRHPTDLDESLALSDDFPFASPKILLLLAQGPLLALEGLQVDHLSQVRLQQPFPLSDQARPHASERSLPTAELLRNPSPTVCPLQGLGHALRMLHHRAQIRPHQLVELRGRNEASRAQGGTTRTRPGELATAPVVGVARLVG